MNKCKHGIDNVGHGCLYCKREAADVSASGSNELLSGWYWAQESSTYSLVHWNPVFITGDGFYWTNGIKKPLKFLDGVELHKAMLPEAG